MRSLRLPDEAKALPKLGVEMVAQPIEAVRAFIVNFARELESGLRELSRGERKHLEITMRITFKMDDSISERWTHELERAAT